MRHLLVKDGVIKNVIELEPGNYTTTFMLNDRGDKLPTYVNGQGQLTIATTKYLVPEGHEVIQSDIGEINGAWPIPPLTGE